jgi:non-heme chloroperoxidase
LQNQDKTKLDGQEEEAVPNDNQLNPHVSPEVSDSHAFLSRRQVLIGGATIVTAINLPLAASALGRTAEKPPRPHRQNQGEMRMNTITTKDGTSIYYKDWGSGKPITFSHGWPLSADAWDAQMLFLGQQGYRVIAHDRRGHGRSGQTWTGNDMDTYADDLAELIEALDLKDLTMVGHSTGGGEVARYIGRHGNKRVSKAVLIASVPPLMLKTDKNPGGLPLSVFDQIRAGVTGDRSQFYRDLSIPFYGYNKPDAKPSEGVKDQFWRLGMQSSIIGSYDCIKAFSETDFTEDLKKMEVPTLVLQGDADQIVPIEDASYLTAKIVKNATLDVIPGAPHGLCTTHADIVNQHLLAFLQKN